MSERPRLLCTANESVRSAANLGRVPAKNKRQRPFSGNFRAGEHHSVLRASIQAAKRHTPAPWKMYFGNLLDRHKLREWAVSRCRRNTAQILLVEAYSAVRIRPCLQNVLTASFHCVEQL